MNRTAPVIIDAMAFKGYGVARKEGKVLFVPYTVTGDEVSIEIVEKKRDYSIGRVKEIIRPSPWRRAPLCPYDGICGGCQWQHIDDAIQVQFKRSILEEALRRLGRLKEIPPVTLIPSPSPYGCRTRVQLKVRGKAIGYCQQRSHRVVDIDHCPIAHPLIHQMISTIRQERPFFLQMGKIEINVSPEEGKGVLILHPASHQKGTKAFLEDFLRAHPVLSGILIVENGRRRFWGDPALSFTVPSDRYGEGRFLKLRASAESFFQVHLEQNRSLIRTVLEFGGTTGEESIFDLYAGIGNFSLPLAMAARELVGIEENRMAIEDARFNAKENGIEGCQFIAGRVEDVLRQWRGRPPSLIVLDPPRAGVKKALDQIAGFQAPKIVYVSCEPTTFSRDLQLFSEKGYGLQKLTLIDMFPQSYHMEIVALLRSPY